MHKEHAKGASSSLNKTITELVDYMRNDDADITSERRLARYARIAEISRWWAEEGFKDGVNATLEALGVEKISAERIERHYEGAWLAPGVQQKLHLTWPRRRHRRGRYD